MNYPRIIEELAEEIVGTTENRDELDGNIDRFLEDLGDSVRAKAWELGEKQFKEESDASQAGSA